MKCFENAGEQHISDKDLQNIKKKSGERIINLFTNLQRAIGTQDLLETSCNFRLSGNQISLERKI